jgi:hypothetical protein
MKKILSGSVFILVLVGGVLLALLAWYDEQVKKREPGPEASEFAAGEVTTSGAVAYEFVGAVEGTKALVAVVADKTLTASTEKTVAEDTNKTVAEGGEREVRAYVCDGELLGYTEWFTGRTTGNTLDMRSASGNARLQVALTQKEATGTVTLADGTFHRFTASAVRDGAGLYELTIASDGRRSGISANGAENEGHVSPDGGVTVGMISLPGGEAIDYRVRRTAGHQGGTEPDTYTTIVLPWAEKERGRGGDVKTNQPSGNYISNDLDL